MKASELRIGNIVYSIKEVYNGDHVPVLVVSIDTKHITYLCGNHQLHSEIRPVQVIPSQIHPIQLTMVWLDKFRFKGSRILLPGDGELEIRLLGHTFHIWRSDGQTESCNYRNHINHVHQLQNLYFALTGEELAING